MSLFDALLLDPAPFHVWIADRSDKQAGSGTLNDPYNGGDNAQGVSQFDRVMQRFQGMSNVVVHLGPNRPITGTVPLQYTTYKTRGFDDGMALPATQPNGGWVLQPGMKILGSGIDVTTLQLGNTAATAGKHVFAMAHSLSSTNTLDAVEISDLSIDCHCGGVISAAYGGIRVLGNNVRIRRVKITNWGTMSTGIPCFGIACLTGDPTNGVFGVDNIGIEDCYALLPSSSTGANGGIATAFSIGDWTYSQLNVLEPEGKSPFIRNCYIDGGVTPSPALPNPTRSVIIGLSMGWCRGGVVEGNQIYNVDFGGPYQTSKTLRDGIVRDNFMKNVAKGPFLNLGQTGTQNLLPGASPSTSLQWSGKTGTVGAVGTALNLSTLQNGDRVTLIATNTQFSGTYMVHDVIRTGAQPTFQIETPLPSPTNTTVTSVLKVFSIGRAVMEGNTIEIPKGATAGVGIDVADSVSGGGGVGKGPDYAHGDIICRGNRIRYVDGGVPTTADVGYGMQVNGAKNVQIQTTLIDVNRLSFPSTPQPLQNLRCGNATYFNNRTSGGALVQGVNAASPPSRYDELDTLTEDAFVLAFAEE